MDTPSMPNQPTGNSKTALWAVVAVVIIGALAAGVYFFTRNSTNSNNANSNTNTGVNQNTNVATNTNAPSNTNTAGNTNTVSNANLTSNTNTTVDTKGWKTYENKTYGYHIQYPGEYQIEEGDIYINIFSGDRNGDTTIRNNKLKVVISVYENVNSELDPWIQSFGINITGEDPFTINNEGAKKIWGTTTQMGTVFPEHHIFYKKGNTGMMASSIPYNSDLLSIFYAIVSSFRFGY